MVFWAGVHRCDSHVLWRFPVFLDFARRASRLDKPFSVAPGLVADLVFDKKYAAEVSTLMVSCRNIIIASYKLGE